MYTEGLVLCSVTGTTGCVLLLVLWRLHGKCERTITIFVEVLEQQLLYKYTTRMLQFHVAVLFECIVRYMYSFSYSMILHIIVNPTSRQTVNVFLYKYR
jgi:hypothetical protein